MSSARIAYAEIQVGMTLPEQIKQPTLVQSVMVQAATENYHRIHWDREFARADGLPDAIISTSLLASYFAQIVNDWAGDPAALRKLSYRFRRPVSPGQVVHVCGIVARKETIHGQGLLTCDLSLVVEGSVEPASTGVATLALPLG